MSTRILVADDDFDSRTIAKKTLEKVGYEILLATNGLEALDIAGKEKPDLILLDLSMPKMNGWETAKRLRQMSAMNTVPILAFTAHALPVEAIKAKTVGCDDFISKPCVPNDLVEKINTWRGVKVAHLESHGGDRSGQNTDCR